MIPFSPLIALIALIALLLTLVPFPSFFLFPLSAWALQLHDCFPLSLRHKACSTQSSMKTSSVCASPPPICAGSPTPARFACFAAPIAIHTSFFPLTRTPPSFPFLFCFCFCSPPFHCCLFVLRFNPVAATKMEKALQSMCTTVKFDVRATRMLLHTAHVPPFPFLCVLRCILCWMCVRVCCDFDMRMLCGGVCCVVFAVFAVRHLGLR